MPIESKITAKKPRNNQGLISSFANGLAGIAQSVINNRWQEKMYNRQKADLLANYNRERSDFLSDRAHNEFYNSPAHQRALLEGAGLTPQEYMSDPVASSSVGASDLSIPEIYPDSPLAGAGGAISSFGNAPLNTALARSQIELNSSERMKNLASATDIGNSAFTKELNNRFLQDTLTTRIKREEFVTSKAYSDFQNAVKQGQFLLASTSLNRAQAEEVELSLKLARATFDYQVKAMEWGANLRKQEWDQKYYRFPAEMAQALAQIENITSSTGVNYASISQINKVTERLGVALKVDKMDAWLNYIDYQFWTAQDENKISNRQKYVASEFDTHESNAVLADKAQRGYFLEMASNLLLGWANTTISGMYLNSIMPKGNRNPVGYKTGYGK